MSRRSRAAAALWDAMPLPLQHLLFDVAPALAHRLDDLAARLDEQRWAA